MLAGMIVEITLLLASGLGNLAWDVTGRRLRARQRRRERRERRRVSLPALSTDEHARDPFDSIGRVGMAGTLVPSEFIEVTRTTVEELDRVVDHFDLVVLRAEAGESLLRDVVVIGAERPRDRGRELMEAWLNAVARLPADASERLRDLGLPDRALQEAVERDRVRRQFPWTNSHELLEATAVELESVVVALIGFLRALMAATGDPYR
jgi:hypothetical protein